MTRVISAAILLTILYVTVWWLPWWATVILIAVVAAAAGHELGALANAGAGSGATAFVIVTTTAAALATVFSTRHGAPIGPDGLLAILIAGSLAAALVVLGTSAPAPATIERAAVMALGPLYIGLPLGTAAILHDAHGAPALGWLIAVIAGSDSAQYYTGRAIGRHKLAPRVSPAKTIEGAAGGLAAALIIGALVQPWGLPGIPPSVAAFAGFVLALFGIAGDLFESLLKRSAGVKDSSSLIPGHGGVLDRIDAYLFALPAFYLFLRYLA